MSYTVIGNKAVAFFSRLGVNVISEASGLGDNPELEKLLGPTQVMTAAYINGEVDQVWLCFAKFVNTMSQDSIFDRLLPLDPEYHVDYEKDIVAKRSSQWDYLYEPDATVILDKLMERYIESVVYEAVIDNGASEQAARMVAMKAASDNAGNLIDELQLVYNKERQATITKEISEIVGGAAAV